MFSVLVLVVALAFVTIFLDPGQVVPELGVRNVYVLTFFLAALGGVSAFTAAGYYSTLFALALGGANPLILALLSAPGVLIGDLVFWYLGRAGKPIAEAVLSKPLRSILRFTERQPRPMIPIFVYIYTGLTPLPGDFLMISLAIIGYPLRKILIPILLGNFTLALIVSLSAAYGVTFARSLF